MRQHLNFFGLVAVAVFFVAPIITSTPLSKDPSSPGLGYNELLNAKDLFDDEINYGGSSHYKNKGGDSMILQGLKDLLDEPTVLRQLYRKYKSTFGQVKFLEVDESRVGIFKNKLIAIASHNLEARRGKHLWSKGVNRFTDMTLEEYRARFSEKSRKNKLQWIPTSNSTSKGNKKKPGVPASIDWVTQGKVGSVKDQGDCGSCSLFAATGLFESAYAIKHDTVVNVSPQQLLDCVAPDTDLCEDGATDNMAPTYVQENGIASLEDYPVAADNKQHKCQAEGLPIAIQIESWSVNGEKVEEQHGDGDGNGEANLEAAVATMPTYTGIKLMEPDYNNGIYDGSGCPHGADPDHSILVVGYGTENGNDFWLIKNSYGTDWGEEGYFRILRNHDNVCSIGTDINIQAISL